jgi:hypothetical protein
MIKLYELNQTMQCVMAVLPVEEQTTILDLATNVMLEMEHSGLGENSAVELVIKTVLYCNERGTDE